MDVPTGKDRRLILLLIAVAAAAILGFSIRVIPITYLTSDGIFRLFENDPWYTMRQVEVMVSHFPQYNWFEPFTRFPTGKGIDWGPLFPFLGAAFALATGASTRPAIMTAAAWVPPVLSILVVPVIFLIGRKVGGTLTGFLSAALIMLVSGEYFSRSLFGYTDHHIAEVLFTSIFVFVYLVAISASREGITTLPRDPGTLRRPLLFAVVAGFTYFVAYLVSATVVLFPLIVSVFTLAVVVEAAARKEIPWFIGVTNTGVFASIVLLTAIFGVKSIGFSLSRYSAAHIIAPLLVILCTGVLLLLAWLWLNRRGLFYGAVAASAIVAVTAITLSPPISRMILGSLGQFFGQQVTLVPIKELQAWNLFRAIETFQVGLVLSVAGLVLLARSVLRKRNTSHLFLLVWSVIILVGTALHVRYEYYCAVVIVLTASYAAISLLENVPARQAEQQADKSERKGKARRETVQSAVAPVPALVIGALILFAGLSVMNDLSLASESAGAIIPDSWTGTLRWLEGATPGSAIPYLAAYDKASFQLPREAYGVLSWWDYGHWITFIAKRPAIANPFQDYVRGETGVAAYFLATDEEAAEKIAGEKKALYVITDGRMADTKFRGIASWYNSSRADEYYTRSFLRPAGDPAGNGPVTFITQPYYETMVARLQNADGSEGTPGNALLVAYEPAGTGNSQVRITGLQPVVATEALASSGGTFEKRDGAKGIVLVNNDTFHPIRTVPALRHYRLIFEAVPGKGPDRDHLLDTVKVFERVAGATVAGEGILEIPMVTNTGRTFTYRQASQDGRWIVPYPTSGSTWPVHATGPGRIAGTGKEVVIQEEQVVRGHVIS